MEAERIKAKVVVVSPPEVGKRSLVHRSAFDPFDDRYVATLGAKVSKKEVVLPVHLRDGTHVDLILWTLNPSASPTLRTSFLRGVAGILAVCDATRKTTLDGLDDLIEAAREASGFVPTVVAVNKNDLADKRQIDASDATRFLTKYNAPHFFTSAASGESVEAMFQALGEGIVAWRSQSRGR